MYEKRTVELCDRVGYEGAVINMHKILFDKQTVFVNSTLNITSYTQNTKHCSLCMKSMRQSGIRSGCHKSGDNHDDEDQEYENNHGDNCGFRLSRRLHYFPMSVCMFVSQSQV